MNEREVENVISAAVSIKTTKAEGSVGATFQNAQGNKVSGDSVNKATTFTVKGGDATLASNPQNWPGTVKPPSQWAVIGRSKLTPIVEWLPEDLRSRVMTLWPKVPVPPAMMDFASANLFFSLLADILKTVDAAEGGRKVYDFLGLLISQYEPGNVIRYQKGSASLGLPAASRLHHLHRAT